MEAGVKDPVRRVVFINPFMSVKEKFDDHLPKCKSCNWKMLDSFSWLLNGILGCYDLIGYTKKGEEVKERVNHWKSLERAKSIDFSNIPTLTISNVDDGLYGSRHHLAIYTGISGYPN